MTSVSEVQAEIEDRLKGYTEALIRGDTEAALEIFTPDAVVKPANVEPIHGTSALREFFERTFAAMHVGHGTFFTEELYLHDALAFHFGRFEFVGLPGSGRLKEKGSFAIVWRRQRDGSWRYHRGIMNSSLPARRERFEFGDDIFG